MLPFSKGDTRVIHVCATNIYGILVFASDVCGILSMPQSFEAFLFWTITSVTSILLDIKRLRHTECAANICGIHKSATNICGKHKYDLCISLWELEEWKNNVLYSALIQVYISFGQTV